MLKVSRSSDPPSKQEPWMETAILTGGVIFILAAFSAVLAGLHNRHVPARAAGPAPSIAGSVTSHSRP